MKTPGVENLEKLKQVIVSNLVLVSIVLDRDDNPHLVFESLNAKGRALSQADLIRNFSTYRDYEVITMGAPSGGGVTLIQTLNILENNTFSKEDWGSSDYIHKITEALKFSFADRSKYLGDPDYYNVPVDKLISKEYAKQLYSVAESWGRSSASSRPLRSIVRTSQLARIGTLSARRQPFIFSLALGQSLRPQDVNNGGH